jgi:hypothetical protein
MTLLAAKDVCHTAENEMTGVWIPAFAGMTRGKDYRFSTKQLQWSKVICNRLVSQWERGPNSQRFAFKLIVLQPRQLVGVEIAVAEQFLADPRALHEEADVELVGHAHAAMHLQGFLHRQRGG